MADLVKIDSGQTLSVFQKPGEDTRISTSKSESLFTFGSFRVQRNTDSDSLSADSRHLSFDSYGTLESLNVSTFEPELSFSVDNRELNFKKTDPLSYAYFSSFYTSVAQGINDVNENFPFFNNIMFLKRFQFIRGGEGTATPWEPQKKKVYPAETENGRPAS